MKSLLYILLVLIAVAVGCKDETTSDGPGAETSDATDSPDTPVVLTGVRVEIGAAEARSCEVVLSGPQGAISDVTFGGVEGRHRTRGTRTALAFFVADDTPIPAGSVTLQVVENAAGSMVVDSSRCFDAAGTPLETPNVRVER